MKSNELGRLLGDFQLLLILFIAFRVILLIGYEPFLLEGNERGVGVGGDRQYHYALASLADEGQYPFRDWWSEFPPVWFLTTTGVYTLLGENVNFNSWSMVLGAIMILSEVGVLIMIRKIGTRLHSEVTGTALAWIYALMAAPAVFMWWNFDSLVTFFFLLGIWLLLIQKDMRSATMIALGALTKFVPFLIFGAALRFLKPQRTIRYISVAVGLFVLAYLPLFAINSDLTLVSLTAQFGKPSYQTVWAIIDGNHTTGNFGEIETHFLADGVNETTGDSNPSRVPSILRFGLAAAVGLFVFLRTRRMDEIGMVAFIGITLLIFYLQSQGWSPQWLTQILPLLLLVYPTRNAVLVAVMLSILAFVEYPLILIRSADIPLEPGSLIYLPWVLVVVLRTSLLLGICVAFYRKLRQSPNPELAIK
ncbi:MAG: hypothetical protein Q9P01_12055 [Anaerolineae bacterium]|nr:hypothetical protein [Anaerolineae bacterium]